MCKVLFTADLIIRRATLILFLFSRLFFTSFLQNPHMYHIFFAFRVRIQIKSETKKNPLKGEDLFLMRILKTKN